MNGIVLSLAWRAFPGAAEPGIDINPGAGLGGGAVGAGINGGLSLTGVGGIVAFCIGAVGFGAVLRDYL